MAGAPSVPVRLLWFPATFAAVVVASLLLAMAAATSPLFVASAGNAALEREIQAEEGRIPAFEVRRPSAVVPDILRFRDRVVRSHLDLPGLGEPIVAGIGSLAEVRVPGPTRNATVRLVTRAAAFDHVEIVAGSPGDGVLIADHVADRLAIGAGDRMTVSRAGDEGFSVRVAGVYRDLAAAARDPYWAPLSAIIYPAHEEEVAPPALMLVDPNTFLALQPRLDDRAEFVWDVPLDGVPTLQEARALAARLALLGGTLSDETTQLGSALASAGYQTPVQAWVEEADRTVTALVTPMETITLAGQGVALAVVIAAGVYVVRRRRVEFTLLHARGVSPARLGTRVAVEALLPLATGAALGTLAAVGLVRILGPGRFTGDVIREAALGAGWAAAAGVVTIGVSAALAVRSLDEVSAGRLRGMVTRVPWEVVVLTLAAAALYESLVRGGQPLIDDRGDVTIDRLLLLFPLLLLAGGAGMFVRALRRVMPRLRGLGTDGSPALYLAARRLAGAPRAAGVLVTASALGLGMLAYASLLSTSIRGTADVKAHVAVGSDVVADLVTPGGELSIGLPSTAVSVIEDVSLSPGGGSADLVGIEPSSFEEGAFWDGSLGASVEAVVAAVEREGDEVAVVVAGGGRAVESVSVDGVAIPVSVAERLEGFPGMPRSRVVVVADVARLSAALRSEGSAFGGAGARHELWARGEAEDVRRRIESAGGRVRAVRSAEDVRDTPAFQSLAWTFGFLEALGVAAGLIALVGLVLYLQTRQRAREISYALARRMGLTPRAHRRSVAIELGGMLVTAFIVGAILALGAAMLVYRRFDPLPALPPGPVLRAPLAVLGLTGVAILASAWVGSRLVQRRADRANVAEVMRAA